MIGPAKIASLLLLFSGLLKMPMVRTFGFLLITALALSHVRGEDRLISLDGEPIAATITAIETSGKILGTGLPAGCELQSLREIEHATASAATANAATPHAPLKLLLVGGGQLPVEKCVLREESAVFDWAYGKEVKLPLDLIRGVNFAADKVATERPKGAELLDNAIALASQDKDQLFLLIDDRVQAIPGLFEEMTADNVVFHWQDKKQSFARSKLYGLAIAPLGKPADRAGQCQFTLVNGTSLWGNLEKLAEGKLSLELAKGTSVMLPWESVSRITIRNARMALLSELEPSDVVQESLVAPPQTWQRDRSVGGHPLTIGNRTFTKGIGVHSRCLMSFNTDGYDLLTASIGIDAETHGKGNCLFIVLAGSKELFRQQMSGGDAAKNIRVELAGAKKITLAVEPGEGLDLADHADWADARLIKNTPSKK